MNPSSKINGLIELCPQVFNDERGGFYESFNEDFFGNIFGRTVRFRQDNHSISKNGVIRGMHFQLKRPQAKLVRVVVGEIFDVAVDLRIGSPTFGKWCGFNLSSNNRKQLFIPEGFAHGFAALSDVAEVLYKVTEYWDSNDDNCLNWNDPTVGVVWPNRSQPILSKKDQNGISLEICVKKITENYIGDVSNKRLIKCVCGM